MVTRAWSRAAFDTSMSVVSHSACAKTWAMPLPMDPAPTTATWLIVRPPANDARALEARALRWSQGAEYRDGDRQLADVSEDERQCAEYRRLPDRSRKDGELRQATEMDQGQTDQGAHRDAQRAPPVSDDPARRRGGEGERQEVA